jgi:hypothetical protein
MRAGYKAKTARLDTPGDGVWRLKEQPMLRSAQPDTII